MRYNIGDKVTIKSLDWYKYNCCKADGNIGFQNNSIFFISNMKEYCGVTTKIIYIYNNYFYHLEIDGGTYGWCDEMLEGIKKIRKKKLEKLYEI